MSAYWGFGGTGLLDTLGGTLEREARRRSAGALGVLWFTVALKLVGAVLPLAAIRPGALRWVRGLGWLEATILTGYGLVLTGAGLLVEGGVVSKSRDADHTALAWHAYLWDPWFLLWGILVALAMVGSKPVRAAAGQSSTDQP